MGLYDDVRCKYPLPVEGANALSFQSKDTPEQFMHLYEIREDGSLWHQGRDMGQETLGPWSHVSGFTGEIVFYSSWDNNWNKVRHNCGWIEFSSYFVNGQLKELHLMKNDPPGPRLTP